MNSITQFFNPNNPLLYILLIWTVVWKGLALWRSARNKQPAWFIVLLMVNTVGILEIIYLVFFNRKRMEFR
ncbi:MAG: hypothetical protein JJE36_05650 [Coriobacteriia bacterium]|nr:hypothetical protein [Coriobacteriia bacterium]